MGNRAVNVYFNPHEREARDEVFVGAVMETLFILIHTSVKLVTRVSGNT